jgi:hydroxyacyl-ACP dehydratase HTD2-like protein with hotdog domain
VTGERESDVVHVPAGTTVATMDILPTEVDLFMFSAATWLTHRIHFDREYARTEGFDDLVVHGPLQGAYLSQMLSGLAGDYGGAVVSLSYRHRRPAYCGQLLRCSAVVEAVTPADDAQKLEVALRIAVEETVVTSGQAVLLVPAQLPRVSGEPGRAQ